jgi:hypothetical protein
MVIRLRSQIRFVKGQSIGIPRLERSQHVLDEHAPILLTKPKGRMRKGLRRRRIPREHRTRLIKEGLLATLRALGKL